MTTKEYNLAIDAYSDNIYRFALKHLKNEMSAKDVVQETFMKVWVKHGEVAYEKVKSYLFTTAYHAIVDWVNKEKRNGDFEKVEHTATTEFSISFDLDKILNEALDKLPEIQKTVVLLRDYEGYNYAEIAEITALSESQVKVYIFRARQALKDYIKRLELVV
jgi:RNA polymerase sigma-70 factor (ECF subfamily)